MKPPISHKRAVEQIASEMSIPVDAVSKAVSSMFAYNIRSAFVDPNTICIPGIGRFESSRLGVIRRLKVEAKLLEDKKNMRESYHKNKWRNFSPKYKIAKPADRPEPYYLDLEYIP
jgi:hypothetical protein